MEGETNITTVEKVKDPRRVAQGKRLAAISREAKERRAHLNIYNKKRTHTCIQKDNTCTYRYIH